MVSLHRSLSCAPRAAFLAPSLAVLLVACGGNVVVDQGSGAAATTSSSGGGGVGGSGGVGGAGGCEGLEADLVAKVHAALACDAADDQPQCTGKVTALDTCGCTVVANDQSPAVAEIAVEAFMAWVNAGCGPYQCFACDPQPPSPWYCDATAGACKPAFEK